MSNLTPIDPPDLQPLRASHEHDQLESELKEVFIKVFGDMIRERERRLGLYGMPHLGDDELLMRNLKSDGLAVVRATSTKLQFLLKAWRSRNPERGMHFLRTYLQALWPNQSLIEQLWMPIEGAALNYPNGLVPDGDRQTHFLTSRIRVTVSTDTDNGTGLAEIAKAFRSTLAARLLLELKLHVRAGNSFGMACAAHGVMPMYLRGQLQNTNTEQESHLTINSGAVGVMPLYFTGTAT